MSPEAHQRWKKAAPHLTYSGVIGVLWILWQAGVLDAIAGRLKADPIDETTIINRAVQQCDDHAKSLIDPMRSDLKSVEHEVSKLTESVAGMAGEMRAWREMRSRP